MNPIPRTTRRSIPHAMATLCRAPRAALVPVLLLPLVLQAVASGVAAAGEREIFARVPAALEQALSSAVGSSGAALLSVDEAAAGRFVLAGGGRLSMPLPDGGSLVLALSRFELLTPEAVVTQTDARGPGPLSPGVTLWRGEVEGVPGSWAVLSFSGLGVLGVIEQAGERFVIAPLQAAAAGGSGLGLVHAIANARALPARAARFECDADALGSPGPAGAGIAPEGAGRAPLSSARLVCELAVDCDYEFFAIKFASNANAAAAYALTLAGVASAIYERDLSVAIRVSYLNLWTTPSDPYSATTTSQELPEFQNYWNSNRSTVSRHIAHLFSGRNLGGGIAYLTALCNRSRAYAVSQLDAYYTYPNPTATWDAYVLSHEIGHNFSSSHTHSCFWQGNGYAPAGTLLDSCYTAEGTCYTGPVGLLPPNKGTIMSYCHQVAGVAGGIRLEFHPACISVMRAHAEQCLPEGAFDAQIQLVVTESGGTVELSWNPSPVPGVIRYDIYRSTISLDLAPAPVGSTTSTSATDPGRVGTLFYRVRAVRASDQSGYSNEVMLAVCVPGGPACFPAGTSAVAPVAADFNRDGIMDLAVANNIAAGAVSVLLGQGAGGVGDGSFAAPIGSPAGVLPTALAVADFNEDGMLDLAAPNDAVSGTVSVLLGRGDGSFAAPAPYPVGPSPSAIVAGDFNEDGVTDLAVTSNSNAGVSVLLGHGAGGVGDGTFTSAASYSVRVQPSAIVTGDFNEDGILDLAVANSGSRSVSILLGQGVGGVGNGVFAAAVNYGIGQKVFGLATGDFNSDGITDLVVSVFSDVDAVGILLGQGLGGIGDGTFASPVQHAAGSTPKQPAVIDFNGDGIADVAVTNDAANSFALLLGRGSGGVGLASFDSPLIFDVSGVPSGIVAGDFNEDGVADVALTAGSTDVCVLLGSCPGAAPGWITVRAPNGGEVWPAGTEQLIRWDKGPGVLAVDIEVSRDGGGYWETIARNVLRTRYPWSVADPTAAQGMARVRIYDATMPGRADTGDAGFEIGPNPLLDAAGGVERELRLAGLFPNPAPRGLRVSFILPGPGPATLELLDVAGRRVEQRDVGALGPGRHVAELGATGRLPSGVYLVRLSQAGRAVTARAAILH